MSRKSIAFPLVFAALSVAGNQTFKPDDLGVPSRDGLVVCTSAPACDAGASILARGGNAVDAAVATALALAVTHPSAGNIGGGGFMIVRTPSGDVTVFDYREKAPLKSTRTMYLGADGRIDTGLTSSGYLAPGIPGTLRGLELAHKRYGKLPWQELVMPAVVLADEGFAVSAALAQSLNAQLSSAMGKFPASVAAYGKPGGGEWSAGDRLVLRDLGRTLRAIAAGGADVFYTGWIAERITEDMSAHGGLITKEDLAAYRAEIRVALRGMFRGYDIISMPPPSSGGTALIEMLNILEGFDLKSKGVLTAAAIHYQVEAMRRAYLDRAKHLGDPDFVGVPIPTLTSKAYARAIAGSIHPEKASSSIELGRDLVTAGTPEPDETTHFSVIDRSGMAVASTYTLEGSYGSRVVVSGAGFLLNNEMGDFNRNPGVTDTTGTIGTPANVIVPGKRMLSSMTPTMVTKDGKLVLITGSPGGRTIINTVLSVVLGVTEYGLTGRAAVDAPRLHHQWLPDEVTFEKDSITHDVTARLREMGYTVKFGDTQGDAESIWIAADGTPYGVNDLRGPDSKASAAAHLTSPAPGR